MPIDWPEPFGLVMIEAMACGTPVIAFNRGSVPEVVDDGVTGFIVEDEQGAIGAVDRLSQLSREKIRAQFEERFTARRMALDYLAAYRSLTEKAAPRLRLVADDGAVPAPALRPPKVKLIASAGFPASGPRPPVSRAAAIAAKPRNADWLPK